MDSFEKLETYLINHGLKMTMQRKIILETMESIPYHTTLEELLAAVQKQRPGVGQATIYRTMKLFVGAKIVEEHRFDDGITRYEIREEGEHHDHLICLSCGHIIEFEDDLIEKRQNLIAEELGIRITTHKMELYGHCIEQSSCVERQKGSKKV